MANGDDEDDIDDDIAMVRVIVMIRREPGTPSSQNLCSSDLNKYFLTNSAVGFNMI